MSVMFMASVGNFGRYNSLDSPVCTCLRGFEPKDKVEWSKGNWTSGCIRKTSLQCGNNTVNEEGKEDGFLKLETMKVPDFKEWSPALEDNCRSLCLSNCSCMAYSYYSGIGCMQWSGSLIDIQKFPQGGADLYIRVACSELDEEKNLKIVLATTISIGSVTIAICAYFSCRWMAKQRGRKQKVLRLLFQKGEVNPEYPTETRLQWSANQIKLEELPLYRFQKVANATDNFHSDNKLGQDGQEIAVKKLARCSGQGLEEFMNEVLVISKLQHCNLVRLLGCYVQGDEKILIYEYMPNRSLDAFLLVHLNKKPPLDWNKRANVIKGIGRGLVYLHRDSRLKIVHRDLKASNILLDEQLNPKFSDFGLARIFGSNQDQANTTRVVGTYDYMTPEYEMKGSFSEKSDVYSFGVLILEIISGGRNISFYYDMHSSSLLGFAWKLWNEDNIIALLDPNISDAPFRMEILRYIHVGLLCVQESVNDRPTVSTVHSVLLSEIVDLPTPKQPAFTERQISSEGGSSQQIEKRCSINNVTITIVDGR